MTFLVPLATSTPLEAGASALAPFGPWHLLGLDVSADGGESGFREGHVDVKGIGTGCTDLIFC